jgi:RNA polymerase sigma-70 factor (ECF subfamily)
LLGDPRALRQLENRYIADIVPNLKRLGLMATEHDEVLQALRERLLISTPERPAALERYTGCGSLGGFVRTTAVRIGLDLLRARRPPIEVDEAAADALTHTDSELSYMKRHYAAALDLAIRRALTSLPPRQRVMLRHQVVDRLTIDQVARLYAIHRATAARRIASARVALIARTRRELERRFQIGSQTADSILRLASTGLPSLVASALA